MRAPQPPPKLRMASETSALSSAPSSLIGLAEQLRDGPLQRLVELQMQATAIAKRLGEGSSARVEEIERLVRLSVSAMEHFNHFTRELATVLRALTDAHRHPH
jgi:hypothetical protein